MSFPLVENLLTDEALLSVGVSRQQPPGLPQETFEVFGVFVSYGQLIVVLCG